ncbi:hypothetical protein FBEOM_2461 [Fusarium beomiforme]|uniref:DUF4246 domain-containing protein n=1 Tax=Fusarium beomiforme TaxID=44412 RepID=A0A9P5ATI3_9HYPO|nr:hypothetical protein FBEOM_2461 [Fusarium beomiforme]
MGKGEPVKRETLIDRAPVIWLPFRHRSGKVLPDYWSGKYQWLSANVGSHKNDSAKFTSYHRKFKGPDITAIFSNLCISTDEDDELWTPEFDIDEFLHKDIQLTHQELRDFEEAGCHDAEDPIDPDEDEDRRREDEGLPPLTPNVDDGSLATAKWEKFCDAVLPDPKPFEEADYAPKQSLREKFKEHGLQIIVKMASIELKLEKPEFTTGSWDLEGQMNEKIAATSLYYFDSENVTPSRLSFRMQTSSYLNDETKTGQGEYEYVERVFGTLLGAQQTPAGCCVQSYGDAEVREGRLLAFPNVFQHRVPSFELQDPTKPGHRRFIALWLVDPHRRIISTANVPPQQKD